MPRLKHQSSSTLHPGSTQYAGIKARQSNGHSKGPTVLARHCCAFRSASPAKRVRMSWVFIAVSCRIRRRQTVHRANPRRVVLYTSLGRIAGIPDLCRYPSCASIVPDISYSIVAPVCAAFSYERGYMRRSIALLSLILGCVLLLPAKTVVFWQEGFPTVASQPVTRDALVEAMADADIAFAGIEGLKAPATLAGAGLLVLPYGSSVPVDAWSAIQGYLRACGNLLVLGGQPFRGPVSLVNGKFVQGVAQDSYAREFGIQHTYVAPQQGAAKFEWRAGYSFLRTPAIRASRFFVLEGRFNGLGYMVNSEGLQVAAPVVVSDRAGGGFGVPSGPGGVPSVPGAGAGGAAAPGAAPGTAAPGGRGPGAAVPG